MKSVVHRKIKNIKRDQFVADLVTDPEPVRPQAPLLPDEAVQCYDSVLTALLDSHAPARSLVIPHRPNADWYTPELRAAKQKKRRIEALWRGSKLQVHMEAYTQAKNEYNRQVRAARSRNLQDTIRENANNPCSLFTLTSKLINQKHPQALPSGRDDHCLANEFAIFFMEKIRLIRESIEEVPSILDSLDQCDSTLEHFTPLSEAELEQMIRSSPTKSCQLDPIPTCLLKECLGVLLRPIARIINLSLSTGIVPQNFKVARVSPTLKKPTLDRNQLSNYRPVSNLPFLSKILEKAVLSRLMTHLSANNLHDPNQSAYKPCHSTETALLRMQNDRSVRSHLQEAP